MSIKRFAVPNRRLRRGWSYEPEYARIIESRPLSYEAYAADQLQVGSVYFIGEHLGGDTIKIGWSGDPVGRLQQLQTGNPTPLKIIGCVAANRMIEPAIHQLFANAAVTGEWFTDPEGSIREWMQEMTFGQPIERCRWFMAGTDLVAWQWDDQALMHRPLFAPSPEQQ